MKVSIKKFAVRETANSSCLSLAAMFAKNALPYSTVLDYLLLYRKLVFYFRRFRKIAKKK
jgi:hypothetical protein